MVRKHILEAMRLLWMFLWCVVVCCHGNQDCLWSWGPWSPCVVNQNQGIRDRLRVISQWPSYGLNSCPDDILDTEDCVATTKDNSSPYCSQPEVKSCKNGYCISAALWCDSEDNCLDNSDELNCTTVKRICNFTGLTLPTDESWARGLDHVTGKFKGHVIKTGFGGTCDLGKDTQGQSFRKPGNVKSFARTSKNEVNTLLMETWESFTKHVIRRYSSPILTAYNILEDFTDLSNKSAFLESTISITTERIILKDGDLQLHNEFHKDVYNLPTSFQYTPYLELINKYGTHFNRDIHIGGEISIIIALDACAEHAQLTDARDNMHRSLNKLTFPDINVKSSSTVLIYNNHLIVQSPGLKQVAVHFNNLISALKSDPNAARRFIHHDHRGTAQEQIYRLLDSKQIQGIPHISVIKKNLIRAIDEYLSRYDFYDNSHCPQCEKEALVVRGTEVSLDGCFCFDQSISRDSSICPIVGAARSPVMPVLVGLLGVVLVIFIFLVAVYTKNTYKKPRSKKPFAPVGRKDGLKRATGIACMPDGHILLTDLYHVYRFNPVGEEVTSTKKREVTLSKPRGVTYHPKLKTVFVCEYAKNSLTALSPNLDGVRKRRNMPGSPIDVTTTQSGHLVIILEINVTRVVELISADPEEGSIVRWKHEPLVQPSYLAVGYSNIVVTDTSTGEVLKFTPNGLHYEDFKCHLEAPQGVCCLPDGRYLVIYKDDILDDIAVLDPDGRRLPEKANFLRKGQTGELKNIVCCENMGHIALLFDNQLLVYKLDDFVSNIKVPEVPKSPLARVASKLQDVHPFNSV